MLALLALPSNGEFALFDALMLWLVSWFVIHDNHKIMPFWGLLSIIAGVVVRYPDHKKLQI